ncbi:cytochrome c oxidase accessory protein CcoG [Amorphus orientalis]|uniref:Cytochrome c oxidase accessory protein FixG n=1 Tax=Amorphus orientalis TaxID=649198 RepID=A0AAE3VQ06_9HYPH|nr:cytochrome c oxidase accessory protein CcoG [Amorphus orientalis]MDQ0316174.1 cytochrome c oxidase accessory protein FixG [Amorphus orientalis]
MRVDTTSGGTAGDGPMYVAAKKIYPQAVHGRFRRIKWGVLAVTLGIYYFLPFVRWDRGANAPDQALMIDLQAGRAYFFSIEIWPQEVYYVTGLLILASLILFLINAVAGRVWCGYLCPQTVWTDLFMLIERWIEGDRRERMKLDQQPMSAQKLAKKGIKHTLWLAIAMWTGGAWILYFGDAPTTVVNLFTLQASPITYVFVGILTFTTYSLAGMMREQVCTYMCPWPRIQAALTDEWALNVTYKTDRGEPRGSLKEMRKRADEGLPAGDCIDCYQCVHACPTGIDIRDGIQLECIQCGLCIDACDTVMEKIGRPTGLIGYDTDMNLARRAEGKPPVYKLIRARTVLYAAIIALVGSVMLYTLTSRSFADISVLHDRNPVFVQLSDGGTRNGYTVRLLNKQGYERTFLLRVAGLPEDTRIEAVGIEQSIDGNPLITIGPDRTREVRVLVFSAPGADLPQSTDVTFQIVDVKDGERATAEDTFKTR